VICRIHCSPDLKIGDTFAFFNMLGYIPLSIILLNILVKVDTINGALTFRILGPMLSVPVVFVEIEMNKFFNSCIENLKSENMSTPQILVNCITLLMIKYLKIHNFLYPQCR
jgi:hypothetical protein